MQISARSEMKKQAVLEAQLEHLLCQNGPSKASWWYVSLVELSFCRNQTCVCNSAETYLFFVSDATMDGK